MALFTQNVKTDKAKQKHIKYKGINHRYGYLLILDNVQDIKFCNCIISLVKSNRTIKNK